MKTDFKYNRILKKKKKLGNWTESSCLLQNHEIRKSANHLVSVFQLLLFFCIKKEGEQITSQQLTVSQGLHSKRKLVSLMRFAVFQHSEFIHILLLEDSLLHARSQIFSGLNVQYK